MGAKALQKVCAKDLRKKEIAKVWGFTENAVAIILVKRHVTTPL